MVPEIENVRSYIISDIFFQEVDFSIPEFLEKPIPLQSSCSYPLSYRHACRFHSKGVYEQPIMWGIEYYWRLDADFVLLANVGYDVFKYMQENQLMYGYNLLTEDSATWTTGLWEAAKTFVHINQLKTQFFYEFPDPILFNYHTSFEIAAMGIWQSEDYKNYIDYIDRLGGMYLHCWEDNPIKSIAVSLFVPVERLSGFKDMKINWTSRLEFQQKSGKADLEVLKDMFQANNTHCPIAYNRRGNPMKHPIFQEPCKKDNCE